MSDHPAPPPGPFALTVSLRVRPECVAEFLSLLTPVLDAMRQEPSFISAVLHRDPADAGSFMLYERWADWDDLLTVQMTREYRADYEARLPALLRAPRQPHVWLPLRSDVAGG